MKHFNHKFKNWAVSSLFVAMAAMAVILSPAGDNLQDIWQSPGRLETIEADINEINERLSIIEFNKDRIITSTK